MGAKTTFLGLVVLLGAVSPALADYGAIAYSPSTGATGSSYNCRTRAQAKRLALRYCDADDARIICWARNGYCALALGDELGAYGYGWATTKAEARRRALRECRKQTSGCYIAVVVTTGR